MFDFKSLVDLFNSFTTFIIITILIVSVWILDARQRKRAKSSKKR